MANQLRKHSLFSGRVTHHKEAIKYSLSRLWQSSFSTWITLAAIAIALSLPSSLYLFLSNLKTLADEKREVPTISVFLKQSVSEQLARDVGGLIEEKAEIDKVVFISRGEALADMSKASGFETVLTTLTENPLPHVLVVTPQLKIVGHSELDMENLVKKLKKYHEVDQVLMDIEWVKRLRGIFILTERAILIVSILLALTVLLVIGNTIKLNIENRKEEIEVSTLIGATKAYIQRPFLYTGLWYGLFGGVLSLVFVNLAVFSLISPVNALAELYYTSFSIQGLGFFNTLAILFSSSLLGLFGAWVAVGSHLRKLSIG